ncbi:diguanylate cyclase [Clostridium butyricum]
MFLKYKNHFFLLIIIIMISTVFIPTANFSDTIEAQNGTITYSDYSILKNNNVKLNGQWDLYYNELLTPEDIKKRTPSNFYAIPGRLSNQIENVKSGYMTLHLRIQVPEDDIYGIYFYGLFTSSEIWINNINYGGHGKIGKNFNDEKASYRPQYLFFPSENNQIDIVINTSVYREIEPFLRSPILGVKDNITKLNFIKTSVDGFTIGIMLIMFIINAGFFFARTKQKRHLYFSIICLVLILRCLVFNSRLLVQFFPNIPFEVISKTAAITFYLWATFYVLFLNDIFNNRLYIKKPAILFGWSFTILCLLTPNIIYDRIQTVPQIIVGIFIVYVLIFMIKELINKNKNIMLNFISFIVLCLTALNDILVNNSVIPNPYSALYGGILFVIVESFYIIIYYLQSIKKLEKLNTDGLTSLFNNKYIKILLSNMIDRYIYWNEKFSVIMIDIDNFKSINDTYGHLYGDRVILDVATILIYISDNKGYAGRFGGDEFILILPNTSEEEAIDIGKDIMKKIERLNTLNESERPISLSIGVYENTCDNIHDCMNNADSAMYKSKTNGKNQINIISSSII